MAGWTSSCGPCGAGARSTWGTAVSRPAARRRIVGGEVEAWLATQRSWLDAAMPWLVPVAIEAGKLVAIGAAMRGTLEAAKWDAWVLCAIFAGVCGVAVLI